MILYAILIVIILFITFQFLRITSKHIHQNWIYQQAVKRSKETGKPLLVIGSPFTGASNRYVQTYECGDICLDIEGCKCKNSIKADIMYLKTMSKNTYVIFESEVLEYVDDIKKAIWHMKRVSGGDIFSCHSIARNHYFSWIIGKYNYIYPYLSKYTYSMLTGEGNAKYIIWDSPPYKDFNYSFI